MPLTNAEKQARHRQRKAERVARLDSDNQHLREALQEIVDEAKGHAEYAKFRNGAELAWGQASLIAVRALDVVGRK